MDHVKAPMWSCTKSREDKRMAQQEQKKTWIKITVLCKKKKNEKTNKKIVNNWRYERK